MRQIQSGSVCVQGCAFCPIAPPGNYCSLLAAPATLCAGRRGRHRPARAAVGSAHPTLGRPSAAALPGGSPLVEESAACPVFTSTSNLRLCELSEQAGRYLMAGTAVDRPFAWGRRRARLCGSRVFDGRRASRCCLLEFEPLHRVPPVKSAQAACRHCPCSHDALHLPTPGALHAGCWGASLLLSAGGAAAARLGVRPPGKASLPHAQLFAAIALARHYSCPEIVA